MRREISEIFCAVGLITITLKLFPSIGLPISTGVFLTAIGISVIGFGEALSSRYFYSTLPVMIITEDSIKKLIVEVQWKGLTLTEDTWKKIYDLKDEPFTDQESWKAMLDSKFNGSSHDTLKILLTEFAEIFVWQQDEPLYHKQDCPIAALIDMDKQQSGNRPSGKTPHNYCFKQQDNIA
ncbi:MAG: hypothetical protein JNK38_18205 [Acidobacteria bacterium]|nr:hypothetical protein [Acidobacteriota bacterium]